MTISGGRRRPTEKFYVEIHCFTEIPDFLPSAAGIPTLFFSETFLPT
jgi:hypothetical protein